MKYNQNQLPTAVCYQWFIWQESGNFNFRFL